MSGEVPGAPVMRWSGGDDFPACRELESLAARLSSREGTAASPRDGVDEAWLEELETRIIWIFGSGRSGSSWLIRLVKENPDVAVIDESGVGEHLIELRQSSDHEGGLSFFHYNDMRAEDPNYFFSDEYADAWKPLLRQLVLTRFGHHLKRIISSPDPPPGMRLVVKEPNGSQAAPLIMSLLPASSLIFLIRDGRDVVDSGLASMLGDSWGKEFGDAVSAENRFSAIEFRAKLWVHQMTQVQRAYAETAPERRLLVHYEQLLSDTERKLTEIMAHFGLQIDEDRVRARVAAEAFEAIPAEERGPTKPARAATPGLWRENFTPDEQAMMERIMGEKLRELGYT